MPLTFPYLYIFLQWKVQRRQSSPQGDVMQAWKYFSEMKYINAKQILTEMSISPSEIYFKNQSLKQLLLEDISMWVP